MADTPLTFYNTLSRKLEVFKSIHVGQVSLYTCGPTVYNFAHIGNLRTYVFEDVLHRVLLRAGYEVTHVMNVTDVGHLQSDADTGEDKMMLATMREKRSPWEIAAFYEKAFFEDCAQLNVMRPEVVCRATGHIADMIAFVSDLEAKGYAYVVDGNVYFDISKFPTYADFAHLQRGAQIESDRVDTDTRKRHPQDFVLWFSDSKYPNQIMKWPSPWGIGFPGWHIECSAMASKYLGEHIDIHCGGIDHIPVHHTNEIAQSEAHFGHKWVNVWLHAEFLMLDKGKMSKSKGGSTFSLRKLVEDGFSPLSYRMLLLTTHYRSPLVFSYDALEGAKRTLSNLRARVLEWREAVSAGTGGAMTAESLAAIAKYGEQFNAALFQDLNTAVALAVLWAVAKDDSLPPVAKLDVVADFDKVLALGLLSHRRRELNPDQAKLLEDRLEARLAKDWATSDAIRSQLAGEGVMLKDRPDGTDWTFVDD